MIELFVFLLPIIKISLINTVSVSAFTDKENNGLIKKKKSNNLNRIGDKFDLNSVN
jgi:hypothetical protein